MHPAEKEVEALNGLVFDMEDPLREAICMVRGLRMMALGLREEFDRVPASEAMAAVADAALAHLLSVRGLFNQAFTHRPAQDEIETA